MNKSRRFTGIYLSIGLVFLILAISLQTLVWYYGSKVLEPRLLREATSQANVLAHAQAVKLADVLVSSDRTHRQQALRETVDEILLFTDPESKTPLFKGVDLKVDYDVLDAPAGSLDLTQGDNNSCLDCFQAEVGLYSPLTDELIGIARFRVSDTLFRRLSRDVEQTLSTQSRLGMLLLLLVWGAVVWLFREINRSRQQAEAANQSKNAFLANMSHELRTPLNAIIGFSELMRYDQQFSADQRENLSIIHRSGEYLLELINDILELSKIEATGSTVVEESIDLYETLDKVTEMFRLRAKKKNLRLDFERSADLPRYITTDERKLRQILLNLLGNGVKFTEEGGVIIRVRSKRCKDTPQAGKNLLLLCEVEDSGPGISEHELDKVFEVFTQSRSGYEKQEGAGLGLAITRQFIHQLGGEIQVDSEVGKGTVFRFSLPVRGAEANELSTPQINRRVIGIKPSLKGGEAQTYRLLVVDDHPDNRTLLCRLLERVGFAVKSAANGQQAVELSQSWKPDLIWMDMRMPIMDGYRATEMILSSCDATNRPVIIALTASAFKEDREAVLAAGCHDFLRRPFREEEIFTMLGRHLAIEFIREETAAADAETDVVSAVGSDSWCEAIAQLPATTIEEFRRAIELSHLEQMEALVTDIAETQQDLASGLKRLIDTFQYDHLLRLLDEDGTCLKGKR